MGRKLYVGNLSYNTTDETLQQFFAQYGTVESAKVIMDRETGRSKGFAFVEMSTDEEAQEAIAKSDGQSFDGRNVKVSEARPPAPGGRGGGGGFGGGGRGGGGGGGGYGGGGGGGGRNRW
jgi:RNA recognition motif-containing protein